MTLIRNLLLLVVFMVFSLTRVYAETPGPIRWYLQSAEQGYASSQFQLGQMYLTGEGVEQDFDQARLWFRLAALQDYPAAQFEMGEIFRLGSGVAIDHAQAYAWYHLAALNKLVAGMEARRRMSGVMDADQIAAAYWQVKLIWKEMAGSAARPLLSDD
ncbi:MAG: sel1 repeat family protein [Immundisolibacteraceae bacterium]|nr:sel1 repeat family protein [Immundisolibacteraceae bacterium]